MNRSQALRRGIRIREATLCAKWRHHRDGVVLGRNLAEWQSWCSAWPFVQVILGCSKQQGVRKRPRLRQTAAWNARFEREVKFAP